MCPPPGTGKWGKLLARPLKSTEPLLPVDGSLGGQLTFSCSRLSLPPVIHSRWFLHPKAEAADSRGKVVGLLSGFLFPSGWRGGLGKGLGWLEKWSGEWGWREIDRKRVGDLPRLLYARQGAGISGRDGAVRGARPKAPRGFPQVRSPTGQPQVLFRGLWAPGRKAFQDFQC